MTANEIDEIDYNVCPDAADGEHSPVASYDPEIPTGFAAIECALCGCTTGIPIPDEIEWN